MGSTTHRTRQRRRAAAMLAGVALTVASCGDEASDGAASTAATAPPSERSTGAATDPAASPLRIGVLANSTGALLSGEENAPAVLQAWADDLNGGGGIGGRPVDLVVEDTKGDAPTATAAAERLAGDPTVIAVIMFDAATEGLVADTITAAGLPVIGGMGYDPTAWGTRNNWFALTTSIPSIFNMGMVLGESLGAERTTLTICAEIAGCAAAGDVARAASEQLGMSYEGTILVSASSPDYTAECLRIQDTDVDYVMLGAATAPAALRLAADCTTQGYGGQWGLFGGVIVPKDMIANDPGVPLSLVLNSFPWFAEEEPVQQYRQLMDRQGVPESTWGDPHSTAAYATAKLFEKVVGGVPSLPATPTRADIVAAYGTVVDEDLDGLLPQPVTFTADAPAPAVTCYWFGSFDRGTFSDGSLAEPVCDPPVLQG